MRKQSAVTLADYADIAADEKTHYGFPSMCRSAEGTLVLTYRKATTHASDPAEVCARRSDSAGRQWSDEMVLWRDPDGHSVHRPAVHPMPDGALFLFVSRYDFHDRQWLTAVMLRSVDDGRRWSAAEPFPSPADPTTCYLTDLLTLPDAVIAAAVRVFPPGGPGHRNTLYETVDYGASWRVRAEMNQPGENMGSEVALAQTSDTSLTALLCDSQRQGTFKLCSSDLGRTWGTPEVVPELGVFQKPTLTQLGGAHWLLSGREYETHSVVARPSPDNLRGFGESMCIERCRAEGGCTATVRLSENALLIVYCSDATVEDKPDLRQVTARLAL